LPTAAAAAIAATTSAAAHSCRPAAATQDFERLRGVTVWHQLLCDALQRIGDDRLDRLGHRSLLAASGSAVRGRRRCGFVAGCEFPMCGGLSTWCVCGCEIAATVDTILAPPPSPCPTWLAT
jgi:hypothetical protein